MSVNIANSFTNSMKAQFLEDLHTTGGRERVNLGEFGWIQLAAVFVGEIEEMKTVHKTTFLKLLHKVLADLMV